MNSFRQLIAVFSLAAFVSLPSTAQTPCEGPVANETTKTNCPWVPTQGLGRFNLTALEASVTGGAAGVTVGWFTNAEFTDPIGTPGSYETVDNVVYAQVTNTSTGCTNSAAVNLIVNDWTYGTLDSDQTICSGGDPGLLGPGTLPTSDGTITWWGWTSSTTGCFTDLNFIPASAGPSYDPPAGIEQTTYYARYFNTTLNEAVCNTFDNACAIITVEPIGSPCDDGDPCTINDALDMNCDCVGVPAPDSDGDGVCDPIDNCPLVAGQIGSPCDDGDACTIDDVLNADCECAGVPITLTASASEAEICEGTHTELSVSISVSPLPMEYLIGAQDLLYMGLQCSPEIYYAFGEYGIQWLDAGTVAPNLLNVTLSVGVECVGSPRQISLNGTPTGIWVQRPFHCTCDYSSYLVTVALPTAGYLSGAVNQLTLSPAGNFGGLTFNATLGGFAKVEAVTTDLNIYTWSPGGLTGSTISVSPAVTTTYTVSADINGCMLSDELTVTVGPPPPTAMAALDGTVGCAGSDVQLTGTTDTGTQFLWTGPDGFQSTDQNAVITNAGLNAGGTYTFLAGNGICWSEPAAIDVVMSSPPAIVSATATPGTVCAGDDSQLEVVMPAVSGHCSAASTDTADEWITNVTFAGMNNNSGSTTYSDFTAITGNVTAGSSYPFSASIGIDGSYAEYVRVYIDWDHSGTWSGNEVYNIGVCNTNGCTVTSNIAVPSSAFNGTTRMRVIMRWNQYHDASGCGTFQYGEVEDYTVAVSGGITTVTYGWSPITFLNDPNISNPIAQNVPATTEYTVTVANLEGCTTSASVMVEVDDTDTDGDGIPDCEDLCPGVAGTVGTPCDDGDPCTIGDAIDPNCECVGAPTPDTDGDGVCDLIDDCLLLYGQIGSPCDDGDACTIDDVLNANCECAGVPITLSASASEAEICAGGNTELSVTTSVSPLPMEYIIGAQDLLYLPYQCSPDVYYTFGEYGIQWMDAGTEAPDLLSVTLSLGVECGASPRQISLNGTPTGIWVTRPYHCSCDYSSYLVTVALPTAGYLSGAVNQLTLSQTEFGGLSFNATLGGFAKVEAVTTDPNIYTWSPGGLAGSTIIVSPAITTTYTVSTDINGCLLSDEVTVTVGPPPPTAMAALDGTVGCVGSDVQLTGTTDTGTQFLWTGPGGFQSTEQNILITNAGLNVAGTYTFLAGNGICWSEPSAIDLVMSSPPAIVDISASPDAICAGGSTQLQVTALGLGYTLGAIDHAPVVPEGATSAGPVADDQVTGPHPLGFQFPFNGIVHDQVYISSNGFITFNDDYNNGCCSGQTIPDPDVPNNLIALAWADLNPNSGGTIDHFSLTGPDRFVVRFNNVHFYGSGGATTATGQIILYADGKVELHSTSIDAGPNDMTQGLENADGTEAWPVPGRNGSSWSAVNDAYRFTPTGISGFNWEPSATLDDASVSDPIASPMTSTLYTVTVSNTDGCTTSASIMVEVDDLDTDGDGIADCADSCPLIAGEVGDPCDPGPGFVDGILTNECLCLGTPAGNHVDVAARVFLDGAYSAATGKMQHTLRGAGLLPAQQPYASAPWNHAGTETMAAGVTADAGDDSVVDWVLVELRDALTPGVIIARRAALVQSDGDVVDVDGTSAVRFEEVAPGNYRIGITHRNHMRVVTAAAHSLGGAAMPVDMSAAGTAMIHGSAARKQVNGTFPALVLWGGNANGNETVNYFGSNSDRQVILNAVGSAVPFSQLNAVYHDADVNMNGIVNYYGSDSDRQFILNNVGSATPFSEVLLMLE
jgi:hypothetical protein